MRRSPRISVPATCTEIAYDVYTATAAYGDSSLTDTVTVEYADSAHHDYDVENATWEWIEGYSRAVFTVKCKNDPTHSFSETKESTSVFTNATCTEDGSTVYTVTVLFEGEPYTATHTDTHPSHGHAYDTEKPEWKWNEDRSAAEMVLTCTHDGDHILTLDAEVTLETKPQSCTDYGAEIYTATVQYNDATYTDLITVTLDILEHTYDFKNAVWCWSEDRTTALLSVSCGGGHSDDLAATVETVDIPVTCTSDGSVTRTATVSYGGVVYTDVKKTVTPATGHAYEIIELEWNSNTATAVIVCGNNIEHKYILTEAFTATATPAECKKDGEWHYFVNFTVDGSTLTAEKRERIPAHGHSFQNEVCLNCGRYIPSVGLEFKLMEDGLGYSVVGRGTCTDTRIVIPDEYNGLPVVEIARYAFHGDLNVTELHIPGSVKVIQVEAFGGCQEIRKLVLEEGIETIGIDAFMSLHLIRELQLPDSLKAIGTGAFSYCHSLTKITLPEDLSFFGDNAFRSCQKLYEVENLSKHLSFSLDPKSSVYIETAVKNIYTATEGSSRIFEDENGFVFYADESGGYLLSYHGDGKNFALPENCNGSSYVITDKAFTSVYYPDLELENVILTIPEAVTCIRENAFSYCRWITAVNGGDNVEYIFQYAFYNCENLLSVTLGKNLKAVGNYAFDRNTRLIELINHSSVTPYYTWIKTDLWAIQTAADAKTYIYKDGDFIFYYDGSRCELVRYVGDEKVVTLPESFKGRGYSVAGYAFDNADGITEVTLSSGVEKICSNAFGGCETLTKLNMTLATGLTSIERIAFWGTGITTVYIPESVTYIGGGAFSELLTKAEFAVTAGWRYDRWSSSGTAISESVMSDSTSAADFMREHTDYNMFIKET